MFASIARAIISRAGFLRHFAILTAVGIPALLGSGCVAFLDAELNNRGGIIDLKLDERWILADTKQMRVLRAYVLIGSLARMSRENYYNSERQLIAQHVNTAVNVAFDAYACAYSRPGDCVYFDERMAELEVAVIRLAIAVFSKHENESLISMIVSQSSDTAPLLKGVSSLGKALDALTSTAEAVASTGALIKSLLNFGEAAYFTGRRAGALYRDSLELSMIAVLGSLDVQCIGLDEVARQFRVGDERDEARRTLVQFYGGPKPDASACAALAEGLIRWRQGSGDLAEWKEFLANDMVAFRKYIVPGEGAFIQASDLVWRACEQIAGTDRGALATCLGHRGPKATKSECGIELDGDQDVKLAEAEKDPKLTSQRVLELLRKDSCRLILYAKTWESRQDRRGGADARLYWLSMKGPNHISNRAGEPFTLH